MSQRGWKQKRGGWHDDRPQKVPRRDQWQEAPQHEQRPQKVPSRRGKWKKQQNSEEAGDNWQEQQDGEDESGVQPPSWDAWDESNEEDPLPAPPPPPEPSWDEWDESNGEEPLAAPPPPSPRPLVVARQQNTALDGPTPPCAPPPAWMLERRAALGDTLDSEAPQTPPGKPKPSSKPVLPSSSSPYAGPYARASSLPTGGPYARERKEEKHTQKKEEPRFFPPPASGPWYGEGGKFVGPHTWKCQLTDRMIHYVAGRVAPSSEPECQDDEPVVLYLAGLGDAGNVQNPKMLRKRFNHLYSLSLRPFLFLVPFRPSGDWWCIKGDDERYGYLGELVPETLELLANFVEELAGSRKVIGLGFSAGAYCLTELVAAGKIKFSAMAFGGLHGHGQEDLDGVPKARQAGVVEKYKAWLDRLGSHSGVSGGIFAMHSEDDNWSPKRYAKPAIQVLGTRNVELGHPRVRFIVLPSGKGHKYEPEANWSQEIFNDMFKAVGRAKTRLRGSIALAMKDAPGANTVEKPSAASLNGATCRWIPDEEESDIDLEQIGKSDENNSDVNSDPEMWEDSSEPPSEAELETDLADLLGEDGGDEIRANPGEETSGDMEELQDANSAEFAPEDEEDLAEEDWRDASRLAIGEFQVEVEDSCLDLPGELPSWASQAAEVFKQNGFVVLLGALSERKAAKALADCRAAARRIVKPEKIEGNRHGGARYSFGKASSTGSMLHLPSFAGLLDNRAVLTFLSALSKLQMSQPDSKDRETGYKCVSAGGDFVLAGERRFQRMHNDLGWLSKASNVSLPTPLIGANFIVHDVSADNGPMRMVPETQLTQGNWRGNPVEPAKWRAFRLFPLPVGSVIVRDVRTLHGGSPNFSNRARYLPSIEFASMDFLKTPRGRSYICRSSMPPAVYEKLRAATKRYVHPEIKADAAVNPRFSGEKKGKTWS